MWLRSLHIIYIICLLSRNSPGKILLYNYYYWWSFYQQAFTPMLFVSHVKKFGNRTCFSSTAKIHRVRVWHVLPTFMRRILLDSGIQHAHFAFCTCGQWTYGTGRHLFTDFSTSILISSLPCCIAIPSLQYYWWLFYLLFLRNIIGQNRYLSM